MLYDMAEYGVEPWQSPSLSSLFCLISFLQFYTNEQNLQGGSAFTEVLS